MTTPTLLPIPDVMARLGIGRSSVYALIAEEKLRPVKIGRRTLIPDSEIDRFIAEISGEEKGCE